MVETEQVEVLKAFNKNPRGDLADVGEVITVDKVRAGELQRLGLARTAKAKSATVAGLKAAPEPDNKMAAKPENKAVRVTRRPRL